MDLGPLINNMQLEIKLPVEIIVDDYREFGFFEDRLRLLNKNIKVRQIATDCSYRGIIYTGNLKNSENKILIKQIKQDCENEY